MQVPALVRHAGSGLLALLAGSSPFPLLDICFWHVHFFPPRSQLALMGLDYTAE